MSHGPAHGGMQVVVAGADLQGFENQYPEVNQIVTDYDDHHSTP